MKTPTAQKRRRNAATAAPATDTLPADKNDFAAPSPRFAAEVAAANHYSISSISSISSIPSKQSPTKPNIMPKTKTTGGKPAITATPTIAGVETQPAMRRQYRAELRTLQSRLRKLEKAKPTVTKRRDEAHRKLGEIANQTTALTDRIDTVKGRLGL